MDKNEAFINEIAFNESNPDLWLFAQIKRLGDGGLFHYMPPPCQCSWCILRDLTSAFGNGRDLDVYADNVRGRFNAGGHRDCCNLNACSCVTCKLSVILALYEQHVGAIEDEAKRLRDGIQLPLF